MLSPVTGIDDGGPTAATAAAAAPDTVTAADITTTNAMMVARAAAFARIAGSALIVVGTIGALAWAWLTVRIQQRLSDVPVSGGFYVDLGSGSPSLLDRIDVLVPSTVVLLMEVALAAGLGVLLRLCADYAVARTGGSLTGYQVGDELPAADADADAELTVD
jgi:hypothetical protein